MKKDLWQEGLLMPHNEKKDEQKRRTIWNDLKILLVLGLFVLYPFALVGSIPFGIVRLFNRKDRQEHIDDRNYQGFLNRGSFLICVAAFVLLIGNVCLFLVIPRGYFSAYLLFPFNVIPNNLQLSWETLVALVMGGCGQACFLLSVSTVYDKWRVTSKESERVQVKASKSYQKRQENKFEESQKYAEENEDAYEKCKEIEDLDAYKEEFERLKGQILLGTDEFGKAALLPLKELNQHALIPGTTGAGKTILLQLLVAHCIKFHLPCVLIDGKGAKDTLEAMEAIAAKYHKKLLAFSDTHTVSYNPIKHGNSTEIKDRLVSLAETESEFYSGAAKSLLMGTVQLLDCFEIPRTFKHLSEYFLPRNVLQLFADSLEENGVEVFVSYQKVLKEKPKEESKTSLVLEIGTAEEGGQAPNEELETEEVWEKVSYDPKTLDLDSTYLFLRKQVEKMSDAQQKLFHQLFMRYEHKDSVFYLYATSEALQTNINMLLDSEVGELFDTEKHEEELDLLDVYRKKQLVYVSLNGLKYDEFIKQLAHFIVGDIKYLMAELYETTGKRQEMLALFDEPSSYLDDSFIAIANKARGAGLHAVYSPQTLADIERIDEKLVKQLIGNVNTLLLGQTNESDEVSYWAEYFGTYEDIDVTEMLEQADGMNNINQQHWTGERGTKRSVHKFEVPADDIKALRTGEFFLLRKANNVHVPIRKVYVRNVLAATNQPRKFGGIAGKRPRVSK